MSENNHKSNSVWIITVIVLTLVITALGYLLNMINKDLSQIREIQNEQFSRHIETNQFLLSTIDWSNRRMKLILFIRNQIVEEWKRTGRKVKHDEAYLIAETIVKECENYSYIDPLFVLSTQFIESSFNKRAISEVGALGINQIMPTTGKMLAGYFGMEYCDSLLFNISVSTKFAVKLIDFLYSQYNDWEIVLADYNGGPWQAHYYKKNKRKLATETAKFVPNVANKKKMYDSLFIQYKVDDQMVYAKDSLLKLAYSQ